MSPLNDDVGLSVLKRFSQATKFEKPYRYWFLTSCLPPHLVDEVLSLPFAAADLEGVSGRRELHNSTRRYFDAENRSTFSCVNKIAQAFQDMRVTTEIEKVFGATLGGTYLRIEFAQDIDGFWLEPHTDIGVKMFTFLLYLSKSTEDADLGTDIYNSERQWVGRTPFVPNSGMIFVPSTNTYHGFEKRKIEGARKLLVINYVTQDWRAREQLAFPEEMICSSLAMAD